MIWLDFGVPCCINLHINKEKQIFLKPLSPYNTSKIFSTNIIDTKTNVLFILLKNNRSYKCEQWFGKRDFLFSLVTLVTVWCQCDKMYKKSLFKVQNYDLIVNLCNKIKKVWFFFKYFIQITVRYRFFFFSQTWKTSSNAGRNYANSDCGFFWEQLYTLLLFSLLMSELATIPPLRHFRFSSGALICKIVRQTVFGLIFDRTIALHGLWRCVCNLKSYLLGPTSIFCHTVSE